MLQPDLGYNQNLYFVTEELWGVEMGLLLVWPILSLLVSARQPPHLGLQFNGCILDLFPFLFVLHFFQIGSLLLNV